VACDGVGSDSVGFHPSCFILHSLIHLQITPMSQIPVPLFSCTCVVNGLFSVAWLRRRLLAGRLRRDEIILPIASRRSCGVRQMGNPDYDQLWVSSL